MVHKCTGLLAGVGVAGLLSQASTAWAQAGPNLVIAMSHTGNFTVGVKGVETIVVSNIGGTAGVATVRDELQPSPGVFGFVSAAASGWYCSYNAVLDCFLPFLIPPGGSAPPITLTLLPGASGTFTNTAVVEYGGVTNNTASDVIIVVAAVPTLPQWATIVLTGLLALAGVVAMRRRTMGPATTR